jgi:two-component system, OmpR family, sensor histidine kinase MtrB
LRSRTLGLRSVIGGLVALVTLLALLVSAALVFLTSVLHRTTASATIAMESIRLAEEAEIDLLLHARARDPIVKRGVEADLRGRLEEVRRFATSEPEIRDFVDAESKVDAYLVRSRDPELSSTELAEHHEVAYGALESLVNVNVAHARQARDNAARLDKLADFVGGGIGALVLVAAAGMLMWLKQRAFAPVFSLARAMERFGHGDWDVRAPEKGTAELREMSRRFNEMASAIAAQRKSQVAFLGGVAHDLRNPLSVLTMSVAMVSPEKPLPPEPRLRQVIGKIERQIIRLERMVSDFIDTAAMEAGELELKKERRDLREILREVVALFEGTSYELRLDVRMPAEPVPVYCDPLRIEQVVTNLIGNALKYSPADTSVEVAIESGNADAALRVTDHGIGIAENQHARIFEPFRRVGPSRNAVPGVGLGLFVARRIMEAHRGRIDIESEPGIGSTFRVVLPTRAPARAGTRPQWAPPATH